MSEITPDAGGEYRAERPYARGLLALRDSSTKAVRKGPKDALVWEAEAALGIPVHPGPVLVTVHVLAPSGAVPGSPGQAGEAGEAGEAPGDEPQPAHATLNRHSLEPDFRGMLSCPSGVLLVGDTVAADPLQIGPGRWHVTVGLEPGDLPERVEVWLARGLNR